mmetsp:Transcript_123592/g.174197  ORF Transcript_123592/g.174197 Transcript_123592/m.174197 type:complete len:220 (+) Transcript_123592:76-735(+)
MKAIFALLACIAIAQAQMAGGYSKMAVKGLESNEDFMNVLSTGISQLPGNWELESIDSASSQVVAGTNYKVCATLTNGEEEKQFTLVIFYQPWTKTIQLSSHSEGCANGQKDLDAKKANLGGFNNVDSGETASQKSQVEQAALACMGNQGMIRLGGGYKLGQIYNAQQQVTAGLTYSLKFQAVSVRKGYSNKTVTCKVHFAPGSAEPKVTGTVGVEDEN